MILFSWAQKIIKKLTVWDYSVLKTVMVLIGIIIGAYISDWVQTNIWPIVAITVVGYVFLLYRVFKK